MATANVIRFHLSSQHSSESPANNSQEEKPKSDALIEGLRDVLTYTGESEFDTLRALHAIAFLMEWGSNSGNNPLDSYAAYGLANLVRQAADDVNRQVQHERFIHNATRRPQ